MVLRNRINKLYYDRIILDDKDLKEIDGYLNKINLSEQERNPLSITEGVVTLNMMNQTLDYYFKFESDYTTLIVGLDDSGEEMFKGRVSIGKHDLNIHVIKAIMNHNFTKNAIKSYYKYVLDFLMYTHLNQNTTKKIIKKNPLLSVGNSSKRSSKKQRSIVSVSKGKTVYEYEAKDEKQIDTNKREYQRHTESWRVRGHYRTYKSGKKVWIKPQVRGKGKTKGKDYTIWYIVFSKNNKLFNKK